jgi:Helix-turn-helix domain
MTIDERLERIETLIADLLMERQQEWLSIREFARIVGKAEFTVRHWAKRGRIRASKRLSGRGAYKAWCVKRAEIARYQREGLLPLGDALTVDMRSRMKL